MNKNKIMENINELFDSYDLFSGTGWQQIRNHVISEYPDASDTDIQEIEDYLNRFDQFCNPYANKIASKYGQPFLPESDTAKAEIEEYVKICREEFPEINADKIVSFFQTYCWLSNR